MDVVGNFLLCPCCAVVRMSGVSFLVYDKYVYYKCCNNVSAVSRLLLSVERSEESQNWLGDMYEQHDITGDFYRNLIMAVVVSDHTAECIMYHSDISFCHSFNLT
jgi:hypothetical protein